MKPIQCIALLMVTLSAACKPAENKNTGKTPGGNALQKKKKDKPGPLNLIVPGKRAGLLYLGQDMRAVNNILGQADDGDAAMGSAVGIWYAKGSIQQKADPTVIFSSYRDSNMVAKAVKQISVAAPEYKTTDGIGTGTTLATLKKRFAHLIRSATYTKTKDTLLVYDDVASGIAFDIQKGKCMAITVHPVNKPVNSTYLDVHPDWKILSRK